MSPDEEVVYDFVTDLTTKHAVSDVLFDRAKKLLGEQQVVDLTAVAGTYVGVAMILAMAEEGLPADKEPPPHKTANREQQVNGPAAQSLDMKIARGAIEAAVG